MISHGEARVPVRVRPGQVLQVVFAMVLLLLLHFRRVVFLGESYCTTIDMFNQHYPLTLGAVRTWLGGDFPLWCPWRGAGSPWFASTSPNLFDPFAAWLFLLPNDTGVALQFISHCFAAGCAYYVCLRYWRTSHPTALVLALVAIWTPNFLDALSWRVFTGGHWAFPLALVCLDRSLEQRTAWRSAVGAAVLVAFGVLATQPQMWVYAALFFVVYAAVWVVRRRTAAAVVAVARAGACVGVLVFALTAVQVLPFVEYFRQSNRVAPVPGAQRAPNGAQLQGGLDALPAEDVTPLWLDLREARRALAWDGRIWLMRGWRTLRAHPGVAPGMTVAGVVGMVWGMQRLSVRFGVVMVAITTLGFSTPLRDVLVTKISGIQLHRLQMYLPLFVAVIAAPGLDLLRAGSHRWTWRRMWFPVAVACGIGATWVEPLRVTWPALVRWGVAEALGASYFARLGVEALFFAVILARIMRVPGLTGARFRVAFSAAGFALAVVHAGYSGAPSLRASPLAIRNPVWPELMSAATPDRVGMLVMQADPRYYGDDVEEVLYQFPMHPNHAVLYDAPFCVVGDYNNLLVETYVEYLDMLNLGERSRGWLNLAGLANPGSPLVDLLGVRYVAGHADVRRAPGGDRYVLRLHDPAFRYRGHQDFDAGLPLYVAENTRRLPRAFFLRRAVVMPQGEARLALLAQPDFDARRAVLLTVAPAAAVGEMVARWPAAADPAFAPAAVTAYGVNAVRVQVDAPDPGFLVLSDVSFPGWRATVDGAAAEILTAYHTFRAVPVSAGAHEVRFEYRPRVFILSAWLSAIGWGVSLCALGVSWVLTRGRNRGAAPR